MSADPYRIKVNKLYTSGKSIREIQVATWLSPASNSATFPTAKPHIIWKNLRVWRKFRTRRKAAEQIEYSAQVEHQGSLKLNTRTCGIFSFIKNERVSIESN